MTIRSQSCKPRRAVSEAQVSKLDDAVDIIAEAAPDNLICPAQSIFDAPRVHAALDRACAEHSDGKSIRQACVSVLKSAQAEGRAAIAAGLRAQPFAARETTSAYSWLTDQTIIAIQYVVQQKLHPLPNPTEAERLSILAVAAMGAARWHHSPTSTCYF